MAISAAGVATAGASSSPPVSSQVAALKHVGVSWVAAVSGGYVPKACRLQTEASVGGAPCDQLSNIKPEILYCPSLANDMEDPWRTPTEQVSKVNVRGQTGSIVIRAEFKKSHLSAKASFLKVGGNWRIASVQASGRTFAPAGLIFTEGQDVRKALWPLHC
jgi:hypothetical protein